MMDKVAQTLRRYTPSSTTHPFSSYLDMLSLVFPGSSMSHDYCQLYAPVYDAMLRFKADYFCAPELWYFLTQLYYGVRVSEADATECVVRPPRVFIRIVTGKGSQDRQLVYPSELPIMLQYLRLLNGGLPRLTYKSYYRSLRSANPNFFRLFGDGHLTVSHIARHFHVQTLAYCLQVPHAAITKHMGWGHPGTIDNYIDRNIFTKAQEVYCASSAY